MLFISSRKDLDNENEIGADQFWDIKIVRELATDRDELPTGIAALKEAVAGKKVLIIVHGYNNEFDDIIRAYDLIEGHTAKQMKGKYDIVIGYTWPGGDSKFDYGAAKRRAGVLAPRFAENLRQLHSSKTRPKSIDIMTHSMGSRLALKALGTLNTKNVVRNLFLTAPAVDNECLEHGEEHFTANSKVGNTFVFHSKRDGTLRFAYAAAEWDRALGLHGPEDPADIMKHSKHTLVINCKHKIGGHGDYKTQEDIYKFLNKQVEGVSSNQFSTL